MSSHVLHFSFPVSASFTVPLHARSLTFIRLHGGEELPYVLLPHGFPVLCKLLEVVCQRRLHVVVTWKKNSQSKGNLSNSQYILYISSYTISWFIYLFQKIN